MIERRLWLAVQVAVELILVVLICLVVSAMVGGSSLGEALDTLKELVWPIVR